MNRYNPNDKLIRLKMELEEAEIELQHTSPERRECVENRIANIKLAIEQEKEIIEEQDSDEDD